MVQVSDSVLEVLARQGGNDQVIKKKVLLAHLAKAEAKRLGIAPDSNSIKQLDQQYSWELGLHDAVSRQNWLRDSGVTELQFRTVIEDFAAVLAVEDYHKNSLRGQVSLHQRVVDARNRLLAEKSD